MDKTININLGGTLFHIEEEAYHILRDYLQAITLKFRNVPGGNETIDDIESRIVEIFLSQKSTAGVISSANVEDMISIIGKPEDFGQAEDEQSSYRAYHKTGTRGKKMFRNPDDRIIGGVCGGIGAFLNTDPVWIRIFFILFALLFGIGILVYLALWIALPSSSTEHGRKGIHGDSYNVAVESGGAKRSYSTSSDFGNAFNEILRAIGKALRICIRVILIITGVAIVLGGFLALVTFIMVFIFKYPGTFSTDEIGMNISYLPDFLNYMVTSTVVPWVKVLITIAVTLPLLILIYLGVKLIFWFRARDGVFLFTGFILWVVSVTVLSIILFNEGLSFAETARSISRDYFKKVPETLYIKSAAKISGLTVDNEIRLQEDKYSIFISEENQQVYIRTYLNISPAEGKSAWLEIKKRSSGRSKTDATRKADRLLYNYSISGDTLFLDEYFTYPEGTKWSFDEVTVNIFVPEGTKIYMDKTVERMYYSYDDDYENFSEKRFWFMTEKGLEYNDSNAGNNQ